jgi:dihydrofolate synthase/folylpolyglutamate synthase
MHASRHFSFCYALPIHGFCQLSRNNTLNSGCGSLFRATNVCKPIVSVITNIGLDHTAYLGSSLTAIAGEKAGIIKHDGICLTAAKQKQVLEVLSSVCLDRRAKLYCLLGSDIKIKSQKDGILSYKGLNRNFLLADAPFLPHTF